MKKFISKTGVIKLVPAMIALIFVLVALIGFVPKLVQNAQNEKIAETGTASVGTQLEYHAGPTMENVQYFYLTFSYYDSNGVKREGKTSATYTELEVIRALHEKKISIRFNEKGAINADFDRKEADKFPKTMALVFVGIGAFLAVVSVATVLTKKSVASVEKHGVQTVGTVKGFLGGMRVGKEERFLVRVTFENQRGETVDGNTEFDYTKDVHSTFRKGDRVLIKYYGTSVIILGKEEQEEKDQ